MKTPGIFRFVDGFFGWNNIKAVLRDFYATLSNDKSYLSGKRLTAVFANNIVFMLSIFFVVTQTWRDKLDAFGFVAAITPLTVMGGFNIAMGMKAKKQENEQENIVTKEDNKQTNIETQNEKVV